MSARLRSSTLIVALALLLSPLACAAPMRNRPYSAASRAPPSLQPPTFGAGSADLDFIAGPDLVRVGRRDLVERNQTLTVAELALLEKLAATNACLDSTATDVTINLMLYFGECHRCNSGSPCSRVLEQVDPAPSCHFVRERQSL